MRIINRAISQRSIFIFIIGAILESLAGCSTSESAAPTLVSTAVPVSQTQSTFTSMPPPTSTFTPIPTATRNPTRTPTVTKTPSPTLTPTPTFAAITTRLPHVMYFLSPGSIKTDYGAQPKQIWRLDSNGVTLTEITHEDYEIKEFDVSHATGQLAYITDQLRSNQLITMRSDGSGRRVIVDDGPDDGWGLNWIDSLRWSPNGQILAYHHGGIIFYRVLQRQVVKVFADHLDEQGPAYNKTYSPEAWSPDGQRLLVIEGGYEGGWWSLYNLEAKTLTRLNGPYAGGTASWSTDSRFAVFASNYEMGDGCVDLLQFDVSAQAGTVAIPCQFSEDGFSNSSWPQFTSTDDLLYFHNDADSYEAYYTGQQPPWTIMHSKLGEAVAPVLLRSGLPVDVSEVLWDGDGQLAIISVYNGPVVLVSTSGSQSIQLLVPEGSNLRWGR